MSKKFMRVLLIVSAMLLVSTAALNAADVFPIKVVEVVTHSGVGGGGDLISRQMIAAGQQFVPQPMVVVNKVGAASNNMAAYLKSGKTDGHTINVSTNNNITWYLLKANNMNLLEYLEPIACMQIEPGCVVVPASSKYKTIEEFIAGYKAGDVNIAGTEVGCGTWLFTALLSGMQGVDLNYVPFSSGGELTTALIGNHVDGSFTQISEIMDAVRGGLLRILAFGMDERVGGEFAEIPTLKEVGVDFVCPTWRGYFARKGTAPEHIRYWADVLKKAHAEPAFQKWLVETHSTLDFMGPEEFRKMIERDETTAVTLLKNYAPELLREGY